MYTAVAVCYLAAAMAFFAIALKMAGRTALYGNADISRQISKLSRDIENLKRQISLLESVIEGLPAPAAVVRLNEKISELSKRIPMRLEVQALHSARESVKMLESRINGLEVELKALYDAVGQISKQS